MQRPLLRHGYELHSFTLVSQFEPTNPGGHEHSYFSKPVVALQVPPFWQGFGLQWGMCLVSSSQCLPKQKFLIKFNYLYFQLKLHHYFKLKLTLTVIYLLIYS